MGARESSLFTQRERWAFVNQIAGWQLVAADTGVGEERASTPVNINPTVYLGGTGVG